MRLFRRSSRCRNLPLRLAALGGALGLLFLPWASRCRADRLILRDGRVLEGKLFRLWTLNPKPVVRKGDPGTKSLPVEGCDDGLRRVFVSFRQIQSAEEEEEVEEEVFRIHQDVAHSGLRLGELHAMRAEPFDEFGRRRVSIASGGGSTDLVQGITLVTPSYVKVQSCTLRGVQNVEWDMRLATTAVPAETLRKLLYKQIDPKKLDHRLKLVRFYVAAGQYFLAQKELQGIFRDFPDSGAEYEAQSRLLKQAFARQAVNQIRLCRDAGQDLWALKLIDQFTNDFPIESVGGDILQQVTQIADGYRQRFGHRDEVLKQIENDLAKIDDPKKRERMEPIYEELRTDLRLVTLPRMAAYEQLGGGASNVDDKLALAVSGWLVGANDATQNLSIALSLIEVRKLVLAYLRAPNAHERASIAQRLSEQEAATPELVARLLYHLKPPLEHGEPQPDTPGLYVQQVHALPGAEPGAYYVQLPEEYDPYRAYPTIVTLHDVATTPLQQIDWWAGEPLEHGKRFGPAARHGYIVVAPLWSQRGKGYSFTAEEHIALLASLRDACRRFAIDTERVYLTGHAVGGIVAWDLGLSHPDLWAGVVPIAARAERYITRYWENARYLPWYFIGGELDGDRPAVNGVEFDRYMAAGFNVTVAEFRGRGREPFTDERPGLVEWMGRFQRRAVPTFNDKDPGFTCRNLRSADNFFWWVELADFPERTIVEPEEWPGKSPKPAETELRLLKTPEHAVLSVNSSARDVTLWLSPDLVDFKQKVTISINHKRINLSDTYIKPDIRVMLEDARSRADRRHPFWARFDPPVRRGKGRER